jgi:hypothetical protein
MENISCFGKRPPITGRDSGVLSVRISKLKSNPAGKQVQ